MLILKPYRFSQVLVAGMSLTVATLGGGCGSNPPTSSQVVTNVQVKTYLLNGDNWVQASLNLNTGGFMLASINAPITDPRDHSIVYGDFNLTPFLCNGICQGGGSLTVSVNLTQTAHVPGLSAMLPNGTPLPVGGFDSSLLVGFPIGNTGARLYFAFGPGVAMLGTAVTFKQLDPAGQYVPGVNIFQPFQAGPIAMTAGMFFGSETNTTGVGFFMDLSNLINQPTPTTSAELATASSIRTLSSLKIPSNAGLIELTSHKGGYFKSKIVLKAVAPSRRVQDRAYSKLYQLSQKGLVLEVK